METLRHYDAHQRAIKDCLFYGQINTRDTLTTRRISRTMYHNEKFYCRADARRFPTRKRNCKNSRVQLQVDTGVVRYKKRYKKSHKKCL